jgi:membrane-associated phospholipid phosphatase
MFGKKKEEKIQLNVKILNRYKILLLYVLIKWCKYYIIKIYKMIILYIFIIICIIIYYIILLKKSATYYFCYPSINTYLLGYGKPYPDSTNEIKIILNNYISKKTETDIAFFVSTDISIIPAFQTVLSENQFNKNEMIKLIFSPKVIYQILIYKAIYNRARPYQFASKLINLENGNLLQSKSASSPSYPSGHAFQSYYLARVLSIQFPEKKDELIRLAKRISDIRIIAGLHFPSDRDFAWWLVDRMFQ